MLRFKIPKRVKPKNNYELSAWPGHEKSWHFETFTQLFRAVQSLHEHPSRLISRCFCGRKKASKCVSTSSPHLGPTTPRWVHPKSVAKDERVKPRGIFAADFGEDLHPRRLTLILTPVEKDIIWIKLSFSGSILIFGGEWFFQKGEHTSDLSPKFPNRFSKSKLIGIEVYFITIINPPILPTLSDSGCIIHQQYH